LTRLLRRESRRDFRGVVGEQAEADRVGLAAQDHAGIVADLAEGAGLVADGAGGQVARHALAQLLGAQDGHHVGTAGRAARLALQDHGGQRGHVGGARRGVGRHAVEAEAGIVHVAVARGGLHRVVAGRRHRRQAVAMGEQLRHRQRNVDVLQPQPAHGGGDVGVADQLLQHVGGHVVADDDHQHAQVANGGGEAVAQLLQHAGADDALRVRQLQAVGQLEPSLVGLAVDLHHHRDLVDAGGGEQGVRVDRHGLARRQVGGGEADLDAQRGEDGFDLGLDGHGAPHG
jgi:hypothetical protein